MLLLPIFFPLMNVQIENVSFIFHLSTIAVGVFSLQRVNIQQSLQRKCTTYLLSFKSTQPNILLMPSSYFDEVRGPKKQRRYGEAGWHLVNKKNNSDIWRSLHVLQYLLFIRWGILINKNLFKRVHTCLSDHLNRFESSTICTFLSFLSHRIGGGILFLLKGRNPLLMLSWHLPPSSRLQLAFSYWEEYPLASPHTRPMLKGEET